jgi:hypothetical protein
VEPGLLLEQVCCGTRWTAWLRAELFVESLARATALVYVQPQAGLGGVPRAGSG